jgi:hypothetical protein
MLNSLYVHWLRFFRAFSSVVRQMPGWCPQRRGTARTLPNFCVALCIFCVVLCIFLCCFMWCLFCDVPCTVCVYMCTEQLPPGGYPIAVKYIITYHICTRYVVLCCCTLNKSVQKCSGFNCDLKKRKRNKAYLRHLTFSYPTSDLVRQYNFPVLLRCRKTSDMVFFAFVRLLSEPVRRFSSCSTDFSQQIEQVVLFLFLCVFLF